MFASMKLAGAFTASTLGGMAVDAAFRAAERFKEARRTREAHQAAPDANARVEPDSLTLAPFRVELATRTRFGAVGMCSHDIYARDIDDAYNWARNNWPVTPSTVIMIEAL